ncbi:hypothetical protein CHS0354_032924 [Potamilus streckersoni]|uniref:Uncharacterized protein n=1 Tax=Potamilus streckersoni TaxID=2493646 RepID=A0AAE0RWJ0_9BIVA|nr:hypothetical protein CHS0354_032924 [Potamilus streckersoni]
MPFFMLLCFRFFFNYFKTDRKRIKRKTAQRKREAEDEIRLSIFSNGASSKSSNWHASEISQNGQSGVQNSEMNDIANHSTFRFDDKQGIENKNFTHLQAESTGTYLDRAGEKRDPFSQLSTKCTAMHKVSRRNSYKKAVEQNSLITDDPLPCASFRPILSICDYDNQSTGAFENKAFNSNDT